MENLYSKLGFKNRKEYLDDLAIEYEIPNDVVYACADSLGEGEDFDGLLSMLEDAVDMFENQN